MNEQTNPIVGAVAKVSNGLEKVIEFFTCIFLVVVAVTVAAGVVGRNMNIPVVWLGELGTYSCMWATFFGMSLGYKHGLFANVDFLTQRCSPFIKELFKIFWQIFAMVFLGVVLWSSRDYISFVMKAGTMSPEMRIPLYLVYLGPILGYIFTLIFAFEITLNSIVAMISRKGGK